MSGTNLAIAPSLKLESLDSSIVSKTPHILCYITNIILECVVVDAECPIPTLTSVEAFSAPDDLGKALDLEKISTRRWMYNGVIELTDEVKFVARWGTTGNSGSVILRQDEFREHAGPDNPTKLEKVQDFVSETTIPMWRLKFQTRIVLLDEQKMTLYKKFMASIDNLPEEIRIVILELLDTTSSIPKFLDGCGDLFLGRFNYTRSESDIANGVQAYDLAVQLTNDVEAKYSISEGYDVTTILTRLNNLGFSLRRRFELSGNLTDISEAIKCQEKAVKITPDNHPDTLDVLNSLGASLQRRFESTGDLKDLSDAIIYHQKVVDLTPDGDADNTATRLNNLGRSLQYRFDRAGDPVDISRAIEYQCEAVKLTPDGHINLATLLTNLGISLQRRSVLTRNVADISDAVAYQQKAIRLTSDPHPAMPTMLNNLGFSLQIRFEQEGDLKDISDAIISLEKAVDLTPDRDPNTHTRLNNLGLSFQRCYQRTGELKDISDAITCHQKAVYHTPDNHASMPMRLNNLGISMQHRFERTADLIDISGAIEHHRKAVFLTRDDDITMHILLNNLGMALKSRSSLVENISDISDAIVHQEKAIHLTPHGHPNMPKFLNNISSSFHLRFVQAGDVEDLSKAISMQKKAVDLIPDGDASMPMLSNNLGVLLRVRFEKVGDPTDISNAIVYQQKSVDFTPDGHAIMPRSLRNLGHYLRLRFDQTNDLADMHLAISYFRQAANYPSGPPSIRLLAAESWARWAQTFDPVQLAEACNTVILLMSQVVGLEQTIQKRHHNLLHLSDVSTSAAASGFQLGNPASALEWLEGGRCLVWSQLNNLHTPLEALHAHDPDIADDILRVSKALENAGSRAESTIFTPETSMLQNISLQNEVSAHLELAEKWEKLLAKVCTNPEFKDFLRPPASSTLFESLPNAGPVVVINVHQRRCDALALLAGRDSPLHIPLSKFSYSMADDLRNQLMTHVGLRIRGSEVNETEARGMRYESSSGSSLKDILHDLWIFVIKPILDALEYLEPPSELPRIWWCTTGPLAFLPVHAAGIYNSDTPRTASTLFNFAISSYTPTVRTVVDMVRTPRTIDNIKPGLLMISQPDTPGQIPIPGTTAEARAIKKLLEERDLPVLLLERESATIHEGITNMETHGCIHFACHASQNTDEPLKSGFALHDGRLELSSIIRKHLDGADLAFLSACQTSTGHEKLSEEAVHLAAGMLAAGYRGVVATMWSIQDRYGQKIAENFYKSLLSQGSGGLNGDNAARALHHATQELRKALGDSESALLAWVPYVHFGM